jgi:3-deoxy-D-manno-octulosonic-acid transferase
MRAYNFIYIIIFPLIFLRSIYKSLRFGENLSRTLEKLSLYKGEKSSKPVILVHAVSVGEVLAGRKFVNEIIKRFPDYQVLITCTTQTGSATIKKIYGNSVQHQYLPFDLKFCLKRFIKNWQPEITFILETEIWPNLINILYKQRRKVFLVNGRLSEKSFERYKLFLPVLGDVFSKLDYIICQGKRDLERFVELGVDKEKIKMDYSFKFDSISLLEKKDKSESDVSEKKIIICASTHEPEERILVDAFEILNNKDIILILAPRHPERVSKIFKEIERRGINQSLFSKNKLKIDFTKKINLIDEIGHLEDLFSLADIAFIGGSLIPRGGQNFLEAVKFSLPISSGKSFYNFQEIGEDLIDMDILKIADSAEELKDIWEKQLSSESGRFSQKTETYLKERQGASLRAFEDLSL